MKNGARPIDIISLAVNGGLSLIAVLLIALFSYGPWRRYRRAVRAGKQIKPIRPFLDKGRCLLNSIPETDNRVQWVFDVEQWNKETEAALYLIAPNICSAFTLTPDLASAEGVLHPKVGLPIRLEGDSRETYQRLQIRLENLRKITNKPEDYLL